jgi:hypothetical protein
MERCHDLSVIAQEEPISPRFVTEPFQERAEDFTCKICLKLALDPVECPKCQSCNCRNCFMGWIKKSKNCPLCRATVTKPNNLHRTL